MSLFTNHPLTAATTVLVSAIVPAYMHFSSPSITCARELGPTPIETLAFQEESSTQDCGGGEPSSSPNKPEQDSQPQTVQSGEGIQTLPVEIDSLQTYTHNSGLFSMDVPTGWESKDQSTSGEVLMKWVDSNVNGVIIVNLFEVKNQPTSEELVSLLQNWLNTSFGSQIDFSMSSAEPMPDGSIRINWTYTAKAFNGVSAEVVGNSYIETQGDKVSIYSDLVPAEQYEQLREQLGEIASSYRINSLAEVPQ